MPRRNLLIPLCVAALLVLLLLRRARNAPPPDAPDLQSGMTELAELAVADARDAHGLALDYTGDSVQHVETILAALHAQHAAGALDDQARRRHAARYGAYIGEVIRRTKGGRWEVDHPEAGHASFPLYWEDAASFPIGWCHRRLENGDEDNVWHKFSVFVVDGEYMKPSASQPAP